MDIKELLKDFGSLAPEVDADKLAKEIEQKKEEEAVIKPCEKKFYKKVDKKIELDKPEKKVMNKVEESAEPVKLLTKEELLSLIAEGNLPAEFEPDDIGQGVGYKADVLFDDVTDDTVIYIPEYGYTDEPIPMPTEDGIYTKADFIRICDGDKELAEELFGDVDWQFPESLYNEWMDAKNESVCSKLNRQMHETVDLWDLKSVLNDYECTYVTDLTKDGELFTAWFLHEKDDRGLTGKQIKDEKIYNEVAERLRKEFPNENIIVTSRQYKYAPEQKAEWMILLPVTGSKEFNNLKPGDKFTMEGYNGTCEVVERTEDGNWECKAPTVGDGWTYFDLYVEDMDKVTLLVDESLNEETACSGSFCIDIPSDVMDKICTMGSNDLAVEEACAGVLRPQLDEFSTEDINKYFNEIGFDMTDEEKASKTRQEKEHYLVWDAAWTAFDDGERVTDQELEEAINLYKQNGLLMLDTEEGKNAYDILLKAGYTMKSQGDVAHCIELNKLSESSDGTVSDVEKARMKDVKRATAEYGKALDDFKKRHNVSKEDIRDGKLTDEQKADYDKTVEPVGKLLDLAAKKMSRHDELSNARFERSPIGKLMMKYESIVEERDKEYNESLDGDIVTVIDIPLVTEKLYNKLVNLLYGNKKDKDYEQQGNVLNFLQKIEDRIPLGCEFHTDLEDYGFTTDEINAIKKIVREERVNESLNEKYCTKAEITRFLKSHKATEVAFGRYISEIRGTEKLFEMHAHGSKKIAGTYDSFDLSVYPKGALYREELATGFGKVTTKYYIFGVEAENIDESLIADNDLLNHDAKFRYQMLSRMQQDCEYFLGNGNGNEKHLWAGNVEDQIKYMKDLWNSFEEKPEWLSMEDIEKYEKDMLAKRDTKDESIQEISKKEWDETPTDYKDIIDGQTYKMFLGDKGTELRPIKVVESLNERFFTKGELTSLPKKEPAHKVGDKITINGVNGEIIKVKPMKMSDTSTYQIKLDNGKTVWKYEEEINESSAKVESEGREVLPIKFVCIDEWNRPIFKPENKQKKYYLSDVNNLFSEGATEQEVKDFYAKAGVPLRDCITFHGYEIDTDPNGGKLKFDLEIV